MLGRYLATLLICVNTYVNATQAVLEDDSTTASHLLSDRHVSLTLREVHHHGSHKYPDLHFYDDSLEVESRRLSGHGQSDQLQIRQKSAAVLRLEDTRPEYVNNSLSYMRQSGFALSVPSTAWISSPILTPDHLDQTTILNFAKMASNAYVGERNSSQWKYTDVGGQLNHTEPFGWESDGLRGHVFANDKNSTIVISFKGTSVPWIHDPDTTKRDIVNDNLFGSCCCAQGGQYLWQPVCSCKTSTYTCNSTCLDISLREKDHYYNTARKLYHNITSRYPGANVYLTGHSLGGVVASMLGLTYGRPTLTYEAYPDALAASRLGLPTPPKHKIGTLSHPARGAHILHVGHTADPIFMGTCNGFSSVCSIWGYAFEGLCHTGQRIVYDTIEDFGWHVDARTHGIDGVIKNVLEKYDKVPAPDVDVDCVDCARWRFHNGSSTTTSSSSTTTKVTTTMTTTCLTPGWFDCRDKTSTVSTTTTERNEADVRRSSLPTATALAMLAV